MLANKRIIYNENKILDGFLRYKIAFFGVAIKMRYFDDF